MLIESNKIESARIKVENIIREDLLTEALEILENYCELVQARFGLLEQYKYCDQAINEAVNTIIYAAPRGILCVHVAGVKELCDVRDQFINKFGKEFAICASNNTNDVVNERVFHVLIYRSFKNSRLIHRLFHL